jgi:hypothetical protein
MAILDKVDSPVDDVAPNLTPDRIKDSPALISLWRQNLVPSKVSILAEENFFHQSQRTDPRAPSL